MGHTPLTPVCPLPREESKQLRGIYTRVNLGLKGIIKLMKLYLWLLLSALFIVSLFRFGPVVFPHFFLLVGLSALADYLLLRVRRVKPFFPWAVLGSGMIIAFVVDPSASLPTKLLIPILAILSKHWVSKGGRHLFNPAAFGLFFGGLFGAPVSWWVGDLGKIADLLLLLGMFPILRKIRKVSIPLSFLAVFFLLRLLVFQELSLSFSLLFFPLVMLPEPMTSPSERKEQAVYGALAAVLLLFFGSNSLILTDSYLQTLLIVNLLYRFDLLKQGMAFFKL